MQVERVFGYIDGAAGGTFELKIARDMRQPPSGCRRQMLISFPSMRMGSPPAPGVSVAVKRSLAYAQSPALDLLGLGRHVRDAVGGIERLHPVDD